jgi:hypothetical protein
MAIICPEHCGNKQAVLEMRGRAFPGCHRLNKENKNGRRDSGGSIQYWNKSGNVNMAAQF